MKTTAILLTLFLSLSLYSQDIDKLDVSGIIEETTILELTSKSLADRIQKRFDKAAATNQYFNCNENYCFEVDNDDLTMKCPGFLGTKWVIPRRMLRNYYPIYFFEAEGGDYIETEFGEQIYFK